MLLESEGVFEDKPKNTMAKMRRTNVIIRKELTKLGYSEITAFGHSRYSKDLFGLWDFVAKKQHDNGFDVVFIQGKTGYASQEDKKAMEKFCKESGARGLLCELAPKQKKYSPKSKKKGSYTIREVKITEY